MLERWVTIAAITRTICSCAARVVFRVKATGLMDMIRMEGVEGIKGRYLELKCEKVWSAF